MRLRLVLALSPLILLCLASSASAAGSIHPADHVRAQAVTGSHARASGAPRVLPLHSSDPDALSAAKRAAERRSTRISRRSGVFSSSPRIGVFEGLNKPGLTAAESDDASPPDTTGAIGPNHYIEIVNSGIAVYSRASLTRLAGPIDNETFMGLPPGTDFISDPQMQWDQQSQRWLYLAVAIRSGIGGADGPNYVVFGFSKRSDPGNLSSPGSDWCRYFLPSGSAGGQNLLDDFPKLGHDARRMVFGTNAIDATNNFVTARIWSVPKPGAGALSSCPARPTAARFGSADAPLRTSDGNMAFTPVPANTANSQSSTYVVAADDPIDAGAPRNQIMAWHVAGAGDSPFLVADGNIGVSSYDVPPSANEPGPPIDTLDARLTNAVASPEWSAPGQEAVWTQHTVDPGNGTVVVRWYELLPRSHTRRQQGTISTGGDTYNASISPAASGDEAMVNYNVSSSSLAPQIRARVHIPANGLGGMGPEATLGSSDAADSESTCFDPTTFFTCRWGDYSGSSPDHSRPGLIWGSNQALGPSRGATAAWKTRNFATGELAPLPSFTFSPRAPQVGQRVHFTSHSSDPDGSIVSQSWDLNGNGVFGDASGSSVSHVYRSPGPHLVRLAVTDNLGVRNVAQRFVARDTTRPRLRVRVRRRQRIRRVNRHRLRFFARSSERGRIFARLVISRRTARRLHLVSRRYRRRTYTIGVKSVRARAHRRVRVRVKLKRRVRHAIRHRRRVRILLRVKARDQSGNYSRLVRRRVRLVR